MKAIASSSVAGASGFPSYVAGFFGFLADPRAHGAPRSDAWLRRTLHGVAIAVLVNLPVAVLVTVAWWLVWSWTDLELPQPGPSRRTETEELLWALVLAPIFEELLFRAPLRLGRRGLALALGVLACGLALRALGQPHPWHLVLAIAAGACVVDLAWRRLDQTALQRFSHRLLPLTVPLSSITFGLVHAGNYRFDGLTIEEAAIGLVLGTASQTCGGFLYAYVRLTAGLSAAVLAHASFNAAIALIWPLVFH